MFHLALHCPNKCHKAVAIWDRGSLTQHLHSPKPWCFSLLPETDAVAVQDVKQAFALALRLVLRRCQLCRCCVSEPLSQIATALWHLFGQWRAKWNTCYLHIQVHTYTHTQKHTHAHTYASTHVNTKQRHRQQESILTKWFCADSEHKKKWLVPKRTRKCPSQDYFIYPETLCIWLNSLRGHL